MRDSPLAARYPHLFGASRYVFIVTYGRSGSTLLQNVLNGLPDTCIRGENANVLGHLAKAFEDVSHSEPINGLRRSGETTGQNHPWFGAELIDPSHLALSMADLFVRDVLNPPGGASTLGFKEIRYHKVSGDPMSSFRFIRECFPQPLFVINTRSHAAVARSGWWKEMRPEAVEQELRTAEALFDRVEAAYPRISLRLHYDDYVSDPEALRPLVEAIDAPFDAGQVRDLMSERLTHTGVRA